MCATNERFIQQTLRTPFMKLFLRQTFPCVTIQTLTEHSDEVWFCKFSPDGTKFASGSKDGYLYIYDVDMVGQEKFSFIYSCSVYYFKETYKMKLRKQFEGHSFGIGCIAWCPSSRYVIACGTDECNELWIWDVEVFSCMNNMNYDFSFF